jgi:metal-sulfur cluster biosynthetic enzyme
MKASDVADVLRDVYDPELGLDLVSLGLVYGIDVDESTIGVRMTLTSTGCPMAGVMLDAAREAIAYQFPGSEVRVTSEFDPPWDIDMADDRARDWLGEPPRRVRGAD